MSQPAQVSHHVLIITVRPHFFDLVDLKFFSRSCARKNDPLIRYDLQHSEIFDLHNGFVLRESPDAQLLATRQDLNGVDHASPVFVIAQDSLRGEARSHTEQQSFGEVGL